MDDKRIGEIGKPRPAFNLGGQPVKTITHCRNIGNDCYVVLDGFNGDVEAEIEKLKKEIRNESKRKPKQDKTTSETDNSM